MNFSCPHCQHQTKINNPKAGRFNPKCPKCQKAYILVIDNAGKIQVKRPPAPRSAPTQARRPRASRTAEHSGAEVVTRCKLDPITLTQARSGSLGTLRISRRVKCELGLGKCELGLGKCELGLGKCDGVFVPSPPERPCPPRAALPPPSGPAPRERPCPPRAALPPASAPLES